MKTTHTDGTAPAKAALILPLQTVYRHPDLIAGGSGLCIASISPAYAEETRAAMAAEIIRKVNSHKELLAAAIAALTIVNREQPDGSIAADLLNAIRKATKGDA
jgi:hypothetical protein